MKKVAFVCTHNSCRSQMAEAFLKALGPDVAISFSAGTKKYKAVKKRPIKVMKELNINMDEFYPKLVDTLPKDLDILVTMGCGVDCPYVLSKHREDWGLTDPSGKSLEEHRKTRNIINDKVLELIKKIKEGYYN